MAVVTVVSVVAALFLFFLLLKERKRKVLDLDSIDVKGQVASRADALKAFYELVYYSCDNFPKYADKLSGYLSQGYEDGSFGNFMADIVPAVNLAEKGAIDRMAEEFALTDLDIRTCCYIHLGFTWQQACTAERISENAYNVRCSRIRKKLGLDKDETISGFMAAYCLKYSNPSGQ